MPWLRLAPNVRFSNRPFEVKRFQTIHHDSVDVAPRARASLRNRHQGPSIMEDGAEQSLPQPYRQSDGRSKRTCDLTSSIVPRGTSLHRSVELATAMLLRAGVTEVTDAMCERAVQELRRHHEAMRAIASIPPPTPEQIQRLRKLRALRDRGHMIRQTPPGTARPPSVSNLTRMKRAVPPHSYVRIRTAVFRTDAAPP
jgi:hypothetical protein